MTMYSPRYKKNYFLFFLIYIFSCGGNNPPENIIENYPSGNVKISARYFAEDNVLEKHFFSEGGEMMYLEHDSLKKAFDFRKYLKGTWIMDKMIVDDNIVFQIERYNSSILLISLEGFSDIYTQDTLKAFELAEYISSTFEVGKKLDDSTAYSSANSTKGRNISLSTSSAH